METPTFLVSLVLLVSMHPPLVLLPAWVVLLVDTADKTALCSVTSVGRVLSAHKTPPFARRVISANFPTEQLVSLRVRLVLPTPINRPPTLPRAYRALLAATLMGRELFPVLIALFVPFLNSK